MRFEPLEVKDKTGQTIVLRNAEEADAEELIKYLKITTGETPFLIREPDEVQLTMEKEKHFIRSCIDAERELMLIATINEKHIGNCSLMSVGPYQRYAHRCEVAIALYQKFCGRGIGKMMMQTILTTARNLGYEQAELEVVAGNERAICLYQDLGFEKYGVFPNRMKYANGQYADAYWMMKKLYTPGVN
jgi:RimJ/RimL family protein N-acetyltransferase